MDWWPLSMFVLSILGGREHESMVCGPLEKNCSINGRLGEEYQVVYKI